MRELDYIGINMCKIQGELFVAAAEMSESSSAIFIRRFMNSSVAKRMDKNDILSESNSVNALIDEINAEYNNSNYGKEHYSIEELYWIGYIYRYWAYTRDTSSRNIYKTANASEMRKLYYPYHTLDPAVAIERILESKGLNNERDMLTEGVEIMRNILRERSLL